MKKITEIITGIIDNPLNLNKNQFINFSVEIIKIISNTLRKINNKLNIYSELQKKYNFPQNNTKNLIYIHVAQNGFNKNVINLLFVSNQKDNQPNYFNC